MMARKYTLQQRAEMCCEQLNITEEYGLETPINFSHMKSEDFISQTYLCVWLREAI